MSDPGDAPLWGELKDHSQAAWKTWGISLVVSFFQTEAIQMKRESRQANKEGTNKLTESFGYVLGQ